mmetsp:Transcript_31820/g.84989  ORF Transcript_31820/g.84989 Transcript_31820/m.84989 type:complete len:214 (-) Transcript_31820:31-672(-)
MCLEAHTPDAVTGSFARLAACSVSSAQLFAASVPARSPSPASPTAVRSSTSGRVTSSGSSSSVFVAPFILSCSKLTQRTPATVHTIPTHPRSSSSCSRQNHPRRAAMKGLRASTTMTLFAWIRRKASNHMKSPITIPSNDERNKYPITSLLNRSEEIGSAYLVTTATIKNPVEARVHLKRLRAKADPVQVPSQMTKPVTWNKGAASAAKIPMT